MEMKFLQQRKELSEMEGFKKAAHPIIEWFKKNCDPHEKIVIGMGVATLSTEEMGFTFEVPD